MRKAVEDTADFTSNSTKKNGLTFLIVFSDSISLASVLATSSRFKRESRQAGSEALGEHAIEIIDMFLPTVSGEVG